MYLCEEPQHWCLRVFGKFECAVNQEQPPCIWAAAD